MAAAARGRTTLTDLARAGFADLSWASEQLSSVLTELSEAGAGGSGVDGPGAGKPGNAADGAGVPGSERSGIESADLVASLGRTADPDQALALLQSLIRRSASDTAPILAVEASRDLLTKVLGGSKGLGEFLLRHPEQLDVFASPLTVLPGLPEIRAQLFDSVGAVDGVSARGTEAEWTALRVRYRRLLTQVAAFDLDQADQVAGLEAVAATLADLAAGALDASLAVARRMLFTPGSGPKVYQESAVLATRLAIIGMGKAGAHELNYVSDVDVIFVGEGDDAADLDLPLAIDISTRLAMLTIRGIAEAGFEPGLWEVDANLRPEGKDGALVRSLESHVAYYDRWAKSWEFQALLKARPLAGDLELGARYTAAVAPKVWNSASRENFVESVQRMRERVTEHIPGDDVHYQIKLGPGGLRDIEFTVQLLQLVHGQNDDQIHQAGTIPALTALADRGYVGRAEAVEFSEDYRILRLMEHRLQLRYLQRTHLMPRDEVSQRVLARATDLAPSAPVLLDRWNGIKHRVRSQHERLFYRPLLAAVASLSPDDHALTSQQAEARLAAIGFVDPRGALKHIAAMTAGVSRKASIQRHLLPVMLQWFANGADPDYGLLAFRRLSDSLGDTYWFLRTLRDSAGAAERLTEVLSGSRYVGELLERIPEAAAWLGSVEDLRPRPIVLLEEEVRAITARHDTPDAAALALRAMRRRELLRLALSSILRLCTVHELGQAISDITAIYLRGTLAVIRQSAAPIAGDGIEFAIIGMGRLGGREMGFGSDSDIMYVFRPNGVDVATGQAVAQFIIAELKRLTEDHRLPLDLDIGLRPEGKNGAVVRSLDSYRKYYERWSLTWEAQALLRARGIAGDRSLITDFESLADEVRFPAAISEQDIREVKRIKARVENERLPQGADPARHLKLGRGSISDVEWFVQLLQLEHGHAITGLRTTSTLRALDAAVTAGLVAEDDAEKLRAAWVLASRARSAMVLWANKPSDVLPTDRKSLDAVARLLEYPAGSATVLEEDYLGVTRRSRAVFEKNFYGTP